MQRPNHTGRNRNKKIAYLTLEASILGVYGSDAVKKEKEEREKIFRVSGLYCLLARRFFPRDTNSLRHLGCWIVVFPNLSFQCLWHPMDAIEVGAF